MSKPSDEEQTLWRRRLAVQANNRAWSLSERLNRSAEEEQDMLEAAHAAMFFWRMVGNESNLAHAQQLLAHVYALRGEGGEAERYHDQSFTYFQGGECDAWEVALSHCVAANVAAATGDAVRHAAQLALARSTTVALTDPEDRKIIEATLAVVPVTL